jgi:hypothetical protein
MRPLRRPFAAVVASVARPFVLSGATLAALAAQTPLQAQPTGQAAPPAGTPVTGTPVAGTPVAPTDTATQVTRIVRVSLDNDLFALRDSVLPTDYDYTHGMGAVVHWADAPARVRAWLRDVPGCAAVEARANGCLMAALGAQQAIYTPASNETFRVPGQRPYVGYLGLIASVTHVAPHRQRTVRLDLGTTGRPALAAPLQRAMHAVTGSTTELGWDTQLGARPTIAVRFDEQWQADATLRRVQVRTRGQWGVQAGTLRTGALVGAAVQVAPDRRRFWTPHDGAASLPLGPYLVGAVRQEIVVRDLFVDGHFGDRSVTTVRAPAVWQTEVGIGWRFAGGSSEYRHVRRGKEYAAQLRPHSYGAFVFTWHRP